MRVAVFGNSGNNIKTGIFIHRAAVRRLTEEPVRAWSRGSLVLPGRERARGAVAAAAAAASAAAARIPPPAAAAAAAAHHFCTGRAYLSSGGLLKPSHRLCGIFAVGKLCNSVAPFVT